MDWKFGDKLFCINNYEIENDISLNKIYTLEKFSFLATNLIELEEKKDGYAYFKWRFKKAGPVIQYIFKKYVHTT